MASLSRPLPPPLSSTNHLSISTTTAFCPFFRNNKDPSSTLRRRRFVVNVPPVFCSASNGGQNHSPDKVDRRDMLIGLAGLYGASTLSHNSFTFAVTAKSPVGIGAALAAEIPSVSSVTFPRTLDSTLRVAVPRSKTKKEDDEEEILVIREIELDRNKFVKFDVFINDEDDPVSRPDNTEFAGSFVNIPSKHSNNKKASVLRIAISDLLNDLDAEDDESVIVTLVPRYGTDNVIIGGIGIEFAK